LRRRGTSPPRARLLLEALEDRLAPASNLLVNGGFELPAIDTKVTRFIEVKSIPGWNLSSGPFIEVQNHAAGSPAEGQQFVELDSTASSGIYQDVSTVPGETYQLRFAFSARPGFGPTENHIQAQFNGVGGADLTVADLTADGTALSDTQWNYFTYTVTATSSTTRVQFTDLGISDSFGTYLDDVSLVALRGPVASYQIAAPTTVDPGQSFALTVTPVDAYGNPFPSGLTGVTFSSSDSHATLPPYSYDFSENSPSTSGAYTIPGFQLQTLGTQSITLNDVEDSTPPASVNIQVSNPQLSAGGDGFANIGTPFVRQGSVTGSDSSLVLRVDYGDGSAVQTVPYDQNNQFTLSHTYQKDGSFLVTVTATNGHGAVASTQFFADVLLPGVVVATKDGVSPGTTSTISFAGAVVTLTHDAGTGQLAFIIVAAVPTTSLGTLPNTDALTNGTVQVTSFDVRAIDVTPSDVAIVTFHYDAPNDATPTLTFFDQSTQTMVPVDSSLFLVDTQAHTITLLLDGHSFPRLVRTRGTVFSIAVPLPQLAPAALDPGLPAFVEVGSGGVVMAAAAEGGVASVVSSAVTGGSAAAAGGPANGGGALPELGGGGQDSTMLSELPPGPPLVPMAVGTLAVPSIEPPPDASGQENDISTSLEEADPPQQPQGPPPEQPTSATPPAAPPAGPLSQATPGRNFGLPLPRPPAQNAEGVTAEEEARDASFGNRQSALGDLQSDLAGLSEPDADLLLAAAAFLARYGPQGERSLTRRRVKALSGTPSGAIGEG
jgi:hypothetical protein